MLLLNGADVYTLAKPEELVLVMERAVRLYEAGNFTMPDRIAVPQGENTYLYMPCFTPHVHGTKCLTLFPGNAAQGLARIQGLMLMNDPETGLADSILDGAALTACRTGAVGAVGVKYTTPPQADTLALIGAGVQGFQQCLFAAKVRPIRKIFVYDPQSAALPAFCRRLETELGVEAAACSTAAQAVEQAEIVITATASAQPVIPDDRALIRDRHFIGIGSYKPFMREYPRAVFQEVREVLVDVAFAKEETGDLVTPLQEGWIAPNQVRTLGQALAGAYTPAGTTLYKSVGMALFDVLAAEHLLRRARALGVGVQVDW